MSYHNLQSTLFLRISLAHIVFFKKLMNAVFSVLILWECPLVILRLLNIIKLRNNFKKFWFKGLLISFIIKWNYIYRI